jgi:4'-phosphopantetheinyl transferase
MPQTSQNPNAIPSSPTTAGARVDIWTIHLDLPPEAITAATNLLSSEEHARVDAFRHEQARRNYIVSHAALRQILTDCLKECSKFNPPEIPFCTSTYGKPALAAPVKGRLEFNLSHSGDIALVAITNNSEVGVDVETIRPMPDALQIAKRFFSAAESDALKQLPPSEQATAFLNLWTRKESFVKATGLGIANSLTRFEITSGTEAVIKTIDGDARLAAQWTLHSFQPAPGHLAAVAVRSPGAQFTFHTFGFKAP